MKSIRHLLGFVIAVFSIAVIAHSCEKDIPDSNKIIVMDTLDYAEAKTDRLALTASNFNDVLLADKPMTIRASYLLFPTTTINPKATITLHAVFDVPVTIIPELIGEGSIVIEANRGDYLYKYVDESDTLKQGVITGLTCTFGDNCTYNKMMFYTGSLNVAWGKVNTLPAFWDVLSHAIDTLIRENSISREIKCIDNANTERVINSIEEVNLVTDKKIVLHCKWGCNTQFDDGTDHSMIILNNSRLLKIRL